MRADIEAADLVDAAEAFLREVEAELSGRTAFHAKVAANALAIAARELRQRPDEVEASAFAAIGISRSEACARIRAGAWNAGTSALLDAIEAGITARLEVDNPRFSTLRRLRRKSAEGRQRA